ncbi:MAG: hypothetical protein GEU81_01485 [Nitriliruptorales bacterium]|nr:hypothetical protein [Nitriliruptorales bacterium]
MNDPRDPRTPPPDDGELLSAWLAGDLDDAEVERVERRLVAEPQLAKQLDATVDLLVALGRLDQVDPPPEYSRRLRARLETERRAPPHPARVPLGLAGSARVPLQAIREHLPRRPFPRWPAVAAVAMVLSVVVALPLLRPSSPTFDAAQQEAGVAADDAAPLARPPAAAEGPPPVVIEDPEADGPRSLAQDSAESAAGDEAAEADQADEASTDDLRERFTKVPEAIELLDRPLGEATTTAAAYAAAIDASPAFSTGAEPAACLDAVTGGVPESVPVRVEAFSYQDRPALAYVVVTASEGAVALDRIEVWVMDPDTCDLEAVVAAWPGTAPGAHGIGQG